MAMYQNSQKSPLGSLISLGRPTNHKIAFTRYGDEDHDIFGNATQVEHFYSSTPNTCIVSIEPDSSREPPMGGVAESYFIMTLSGDTSSTRIYRFLDPLKSGNTEGLYLLSAKGTTWGSVSGTLSNQTDLANAFSNKVDKVSGKGLSTNDFTTAYKNSLDGLKDLAFIAKDGTSSTKYLRGDGTWQGITWGNITGTLSNQTDLQNALNGKQATLVSGTNIKTVGGYSLLGSGNVSVGLIATVLWTNSSVTADFAQQTVTLSNSLSGFEYYSVVCRRTKGNPQYLSTGLIPVTSAEGDGTTSRLYNPAECNYMRQFNTEHSIGTSFKISTCGKFATYGSTNQTTANSYLIPWKIIGWKWR